LGVPSLYIAIALASGRRGIYPFPIQLISQTHVISTGLAENWQDWEGYLHWCGSIHHPTMPWEQANDGCRLPTNYTGNGAGRENSHFYLTPWRNVLFSLFSASARPQNNLH